MADKPVDYYAILEVAPTASAEQIRTAYKKAALRWHPDRVASDSPERPARTKKFQQINDAYFTLSDPTRRRDYDAARQWNNEDTASEPADEEVPRPPPKKSGWHWFPWGSGQKPDFEETQWESAFEEMMRDSGMGEEEEEKGKKATKPTGRFWAIVGGISGFGLGTIVGNLPGGFAGAVMGGKLGSIRDTHGKSVYEVFQELPQAEKAKVLSELAAKIFAQAVSG